ncbi:pentatricopeptide repeat-containing protein At3g57430, chloroplastic-like [Magnolia sinica]|uniref:pentatricopeptide repeat-containing protein At3g57430, chloroplastic-like n=1 Tax=Magnolia sinica TaxID=86752 RepID=UPI0026589E27|nr:pentatricopeptide repeat-containing protein At3g57430, chloroplastic-like [Magnolia sinica]
MNYFRCSSSTAFKFRNSHLFIKSVKNHIFPAHLIRSDHTHFCISLNSSLHSISRNTHKVFDESPQRIPWTRLSRHSSDSVEPATSSFSDSSCSSFESISRNTQKPFNEIPHQSAQAEKSAQVFDETTERNVISWTAKMSSFARSGREEQAIGCFKSMLLHGERPNHVTFLSTIHAIGAIGSEDLTHEIHGLLIKIGFESELSVVTALLGIYSLHGISDAVKVFNHIPVKDLILWSAMVAACSKNGQFVKAIETFREMQHFGIEPNNVSILSVLNACADLGALSAGKQIHGFSMRKEFSLDTNIQNSLVDMYTKCGELDTSILVFDRIKKTDLVSWNTMIFGCAENGRPRKALAMFSLMWSCCIAPDETTARSALSACSRMGELVFGLGLHSYILKDGLLNFISVGTALLKLYADFSEVETARTLFDRLRHKDVIAWSAMVSVYARAGHPDRAVEMFKQMQMANQDPNEITLVSLLQACSSMGGQEHGKSIHAHVLRVGCSCNVFITSALIDFYCRFGRLRQGRALFDQVPNRDLVCWGSMINGYAMNGCGEMALEAFSKMLRCGVRPNDVVFISILSACSHCGLVDEGWRLFHYMEGEYGIKPSLVHYACMVDLLSRCGRVAEAFEFVKGMPVEPDVSVWGALIGGCRSGQDNVEVAEVAARQLIRLDPDNTSYYVILSNVYAECGRWGDVERLRRIVKEKRLRKTVGYSMVEAS